MRPATGDLRPNSKSGQGGKSEAVEKAHCELRVQCAGPAVLRVDILHHLYLCVRLQFCLRMTMKSLTGVSRPYGRA